MARSDERYRRNFALFQLQRCALQSPEVLDVVTITFPDRDAEKRALAYMLGRFSGRVSRSGEHLVPEAALEALADQNIPFSVKGKAT